MIAIIFEVWPADGRKDAYLNFAAKLKPELEKMDGFHFRRALPEHHRPGKMLSLSFWRDEAAVAQWRNHEGHRGVQEAGRRGVFRDYRLRVAAVIRDYGMTSAERRRPPTAARVTSS
jgi:heme-degrading monooxygenase HmoA